MALPWNGSDLGVLVAVPVGVKHLRWNSTPLIVDGLKALFGLPSTGYHRCLIRHRPAVLQRPMTGPALADYIGPAVSAQIRKVYVFRWLVGLTLNGERSLIIEEGRVLSIKETRSDYERSRLSRQCIKRWFGDIETFQREVRALLHGLTYQALRERTVAIIETYDPSALLWATALLARASPYLN